MKEEGTLVIRRETGVDILRSLVVMLDNQKIGKVKENETIKFKIDPGEHEVYLKMVLAKTKKIKFKINHGEMLNFYCRGKYKTYLETLMLASDMLFYPNKIYLLDYLGAEPFPSKRYSYEITTWKKIFYISYLALFLVGGILIFLKR